MSKHFLLFCFFLISIATSAQKLIYKSNGNVMNSQNKVISPDEVTTLLKDYEHALELYNDGRNKKKIGNIMLIGGLGLISTDLVIASTADVDYPSALTIVGVLSTIIAIPVKIGYSKKIKSAISNYNSANNFGYTKVNIDMEFISNNNGTGLRIKF